MNFTEMEAKVREATNNEPWGASSTLMQEIANGTFNYQTLNEIMPMIYRRFTEKTAEEWRQIYKALQLLEFLIKHGSERVIDDARSHITLLKMLRQFHYIDQNGKDQGINVRNRAKELAELLSDVDRIRAERKKARSTRGKYTGLEGGSGFGVSGSRYSGFGSESAYSGGGAGGGYGGFSGGVYGDGGGFGGQENEWRSSSGNRDKFEEYDEYDEGAASASTPSRVKREVAAPKTTEPPKKKEPEVDLFSFDDPTPAESSTPAAAAGPSSGSVGGLESLMAPAASTSGAVANDNDDDDDFDEFQSAPAAPVAGPGTLPVLTSAPASSTASFVAPKPVSAPRQADLSSMVGLSSISPAPSSSGTPTANYSAFKTPLPTATTSAAAPAPSQIPKPTGYQPSGPNYFTSVQAAPPKPAGNSTGISTSASLKPALSGVSKSASGSGDAFGALWNKTSAGVKKTGTPTSGPTVGQLAKEKSSAGIWGAPSQSPAPSMGSKPPTTGSSGLDDLLG